MENKKKESEIFKLYNEKKLQKEKTALWNKKMK